MVSDDLPFPSPARVFLVDNHPIVLSGLQMLLSPEPDLLVCGHARDVPTAMEKILALKADLAIVALSLGTSSGLDLIQQIHLLSPAVKILVFTVNDEIVFVRRALRAGAHGYVTKDEQPEKILAAIRSLMRGKCILGGRIAAKMSDSISAGGSVQRDGVELLSPRELEVLELLSCGYKSREIADRLQVKVRTIESHREHLKTKLRLHSAAELNHFALRYHRRTAPEASPAEHPR